MITYYKDPSAVLDFQFDWTDWLGSGETISTATIIITPSGEMTAAAPTTSLGVVTVWLSAGTDGHTYMVACKITTNQLRTDERTFLVNCFNR